MGLRALDLTSSIEKKKLIKHLSLFLSLSPPQSRLLYGLPTYVCFSYRELGWDKAYEQGDGDNRTAA